MPAGAIELVATVAIGYLTSKVPNLLCASVIGSLIPPIIGMIGIATISLKHQLALTACCWIQSFLGPAIILSCKATCGKRLDLLC